MEIIERGSRTAHPRVWRDDVPVGPYNDGSNDADRNKTPTYSSTAVLLVDSREISKTPNLYDMMGYDTGNSFGETLLPFFYSIFCARKTRKTQRSWIVECCTRLAAVGFLDLRRTCTSQV